MEDFNSTRSVRTSKEDENWLSTKKKTHSLLYNDSLLKVKEMDMGVTHKPCGSPLYQLGKSKYKREIAKSDSAFISFYGS